MARQGYTGTVGVLQVEGIGDLRKALKAYPPAVRREFNRELKGAADGIAQLVRAQVPVQSGTAARSVRVAYTGKFLGIRAGGPSAPYYPWLDFGGTLHATGRRYNTQHRPHFKDGRWLYPIAERNRRKAVDAGLRAVDKAKRQVFGAGGAQRGAAVAAGMRVAATRRALRKYKAA